MAYAALISLGQILEQILNHDECLSMSLLEEQKVKDLLGNITFIQIFLVEYSQNGGEIVESLEVRTRDAAYEAADIIESQISNQFASESTSPGEWRLPKQLISALKNMMPAWHHNQDLQLVLQEIDLIVEEVMMYMNSCRVDDRQRGATSPISSSRRANSNKVRMVGFDDDLMQIKARLCGESSKLQTISIVGMGGIGKTTLAKNIFDDPSLGYYFDIRAWMTVSQNYRVREILLGLLGSMKMLNDGMHQESNAKLAERLHKCLKSRRYLIIMDDMWDTKAWDDVRIFFPDDDNGSRVLLTTRLSEVAVYANSCSSIHQLRFLDQCQSWILLTELVFPGKSCPPQLENTGKKIARSCRGLPLAISLVAGLLAEDKNRLDHWENIGENIAENLSMAATRNDEQLSKIFSLSYNHLPHHLRACFLYLGVFPEDYEIPVSKLSKLWAAEGFLRPVSHKSLQEIADECIEDLANRSLILVHKQRYNGRIKTCSLHDVLRDLCVRKARQEKFLDHVMERYTHGFPDSLKIQRRLSIHTDVVDEDDDLHASPARSLLYFCPYGSSLSYFHFHFRLLKVLDADRVYFEELPLEILQLVHLRYIAFTLNCTSYCTFPSSILRLRRLQTLIIRRGPSFRPFIHAFYLPVEIWKMPQLNHISVFYTSFLADPSSLRFDRRTPCDSVNLETLSNITNFNFTKKAVRMMRKLKKLSVFYGAIILARRSDYGLNNLVHLPQLEKLHFTYYRPLSCNVPTPKIAFPRTLNKLTLSECRFPWDHMTVVGSLPNLEVLKLLFNAFCGREWQPVEEEFSQLKYLAIHTTDLECWKAESRHFPRLEHLRLENCSRLENIPIDMGEIPRIELIELRNCSSSAVDSAKEILEEQQNQGNESLQVRFYS
ncbi:putative late blight resistance proteinR1A-10 [Sesamum alatum]|uniref:Late blight resistance proteinR1A-10 n=1 Tax=Sesamum alatum TaxID=300844 RepID=A0AAE2CWB3_9LAMI|nr:putative late blight resistance proteinR1A-10 [Sesamum alatum]